MAVPLAVCVAIDPQDPGVPQVSFQSAPALARSKVSAAVMLTVPFTCASAVVGVTATTIGGGGATVMVTVAVAVGFAFDAATTVTIEPVGMLVGAE